MPLLFPISGLIGVLRSPVFPPWLSSGTKGKVSLRNSLLDIAVFVLLSGRNTVASCVGWQTTLNVVSMLLLYLVWDPTAPLLRRLPEWTLRLPLELMFVLVLVGWKKVKHPQLSFFVSRKSELLTGLLQPYVRMTDPLYPIIMTCAVFFRPFMLPCLQLKLPILL